MKNVQILLSAAACLIVLLSIQPAEAQKVLKFNFFPPAKKPGFAKVFKPYVDQVTADSKGTVKVDSFPGGTLGRNPRQQFKLRG